MYFHTDKLIHRVYKSLCRSLNEFSSMLIANLSKDAATHILLKCDEQFEKLGNLTIKYGNTTEIHFKIKDTNTKSMQEQLEAIR